MASIPYRNKTKFLNATISAKKSPKEICQRLSAKAQTVTDSRNYGSFPLISILLKAAKDQELMIEEKRYLGFVGIEGNGRYFAAAWIRGM